MADKGTLDSRIEELSIKLNETMLETDINNPKYLENTINLILTSVKDILNFNCVEFMLFRNLDGSIPKVGEIGTDPRKKTDMRLHWITGIGYDEGYIKDSTNKTWDINHMPRGPPLSVFNPKFNFENLFFYDNIEYIKKLENEGKVIKLFYEKMKKVYEIEEDPANFPIGGFAEFFYQIYVPVTRSIPEGKEIIGLISIDTPLDIPLNEPPSKEKMESVMRMVKLAQLPIMNAAMVYELKTTNNKLEDTLNRLKEAQATIVEQEKMITEQSMAGGFAHEIRNALSPISTYAAILLGSGSRKGLIDSLGISDEEKEQFRERILKMKNQNEYALDITSMIMNYAKIESQKSYEEIRIKPLLEEIVDSHADEFVERQISFKQSLNYDGIIYSNPTQIRQVVDNLIINSEHAVEKTDKKDISLTLDYMKEPDGRYSRGNAVRISVYDSGCGIEDSVREKIFRPFFTTRPDKKGAGLGLATSRRIARLYEGDIVFESSPERTVFTLYLPVGEKRDAEAKRDER